MFFKYKHPEYFKDIPQPDYNRESGNIILYGAGVNGAIVMRILEKRGIKILCFADSYVSKHGTEHFGYHVISPNELKENYKDATIIITPYNKGTLIEDLKASGCSKVYDCAPLFLEFDTNDVKDVVPPILDIFHIAHTFLDKRSKSGFALTIVITERCTLRCKECMAFIPYFDNPVDYDFRSLKKSINQVLPLGMFSNIYLEGGEPMMHKDFKRIVADIVSYDKVEHLWIITNGTIIPDDEAIQVLKCEKVFVWISDYGKYSCKKTELKNLLEKNNVNVHSTSQHWYKVTHACDYKRGDKENQNVFNNCCKGLDILNPFLIKNRIYRCQFHGRSEELNIIPFNEQDSVDVFVDADELKSNITNLLDRKTFIDACRYCCGRGFNSLEVPVAEQAGAEICPLERFV